LIYLHVHSQKGVSFRSNSVVVRGSVVITGETRSSVVMAIPGMSSPVFSLNTEYLTFMEVCVYLLFLLFVLVIRFFIMFMYFM
jgi:hypothetical protein